jgi:hypothetical protein
MQKTYKIPRHINRPITFVFGADLIELGAVYCTFIYMYVIRYPPYFPFVIGLLAAFIVIKRKNPQGFFKHLAYVFGLSQLDYYPKFSQQEFLE